MSNVYDIIIVGSGPIGSSVAYFLSKDPKFKGKKIALITQDPSQERSSTYLYAGGAVNYSWWPGNAVKAEMTKVTADFIKDVAKQGEDLSLFEDYYLFVDQGVCTPALNVSGAKLSSYLSNQAEKAGIEFKKNTVLQEVQKQDNSYKLTTDKGEFSAEKVVLAVGSQTNKFLPQANTAYVKRTLFVLDLPITENHMNWPHIVIPFKKGLIYSFIKKWGAGYKMLFGQDNVIEPNDKWEEENNFQELLDMGVSEVMPFLKNTKVEKVLWGFDAKQSAPIFFTEDNNLFAVNCGYAVRACIYIGQEMVKKL